MNLTDGLDGLAAGLLAISFSVFSAIAYISGRVDFSDYLNIMYLPGAGELTIFTAAITGKNQADPTSMIRCLQFFKNFK